MDDFVPAAVLTRASRKRQIALLAFATMVPASWPVVMYFNHWSFSHSSSAGDSANTPAGQFVTAVMVCSLSALGIALGVFVMRSSLRQKSILVMRRGPLGLEISTGTPTAANLPFVVPPRAQVHLEIAPCGRAYRSLSERYGLRVTHPGGSLLFRLDEAPNAIDAGALLAELGNTGSTVTADDRVLKYASAPTAPPTTPTPWA